MWWQNDRFVSANGAWRFVAVFAWRSRRLRLRSRIKDVASVQSGRDNQLIGYGLVVGLQGTGDSLRSSPFTAQSLRAMLQNLGISTQDDESRSKNIAAVLVTANLPPFASPGSRIDVTVGSLGDCHLAARRHAGHDLALRRRRPDLCGRAGIGRRYRIQRTGRRGNADAGRHHVGPRAERRHHRARTAGEVQGCASISCFSCAIRISRPPSAWPQRSTATRKAQYGGSIAEARDSQAVVIDKPKMADLSRLMADIENLVIETDVPARVVINERTGTIVIGQDVRINKVAVSYGTLTVQVTRDADRRAAGAVFARRDGDRAQHDDRRGRRTAAPSPFSTARICARSSPGSTASA